MFEIIVLLISLFNHGLSLENGMFKDDSMCPITTYGIGQDYLPTEHCMHTIKESYPVDCTDVMKNYNPSSGIYWIKPQTVAEPFRVLCDNDIKGGGWIHIQKRYDGSQDFYLPWRNYKHGFGNLKKEHWLGLEYVNALTRHGGAELLVELYTSQDEVFYGHFDTFMVSSEHEGYNLCALSWSEGNAGDCLTHHKGMNFSTYDLDRDQDSDRNCAEVYLGAWWYKSCDASNLNGKFLNMDLPKQYFGKGAEWDCIGTEPATHFLARTRMLIRPGTH